MRAHAPHSFYAPLEITNAQHGGPDNLRITRYHLNIKFGPVYTRIWTDRPASCTDGDPEGTVIGFQSGGRLITDWAGLRPDAIRLHVSTRGKRRRRTLPGISADQPTAAGGLLVVVLHEEEFRDARGVTGGPRRRRREDERGTPEAGARAYDIKHYNYYLNSSRMAPGVARSPLFVSPPFSCLSLPPSSPPHSIPFHRAAVLPLAPSFL